MLGVYWNSILRYRKRGRRLAEILLEKRRQVGAATVHCRTFLSVTKATQVTMAKEVDFLQPLISKLSQCIRKLVRENTSSVVLPDTWEMHKETVEACMDSDDQVDKAIMRTLAERNVRVQPPKDLRASGRRSRRQHVISLLDSIRSTHDINAISTACLDSSDDRASLVAALLEWTASTFRHGIYRVFAAVRFLRKWKLAGVDVDSHILAFLSRNGDINGLEISNVYHAISELVRSQTFSVGRYLQWLMARGSMDEYQHGMGKVSVFSSQYLNGSLLIRNGSQTIKADAGLIVHLPVNRLPEHVCNLRNILMARAGISASEEVTTTQLVKNYISHQIPTVYGPKPEPSVPQSPFSANLTWAVKSEISQWIRRGVAEHYRDEDEDVSALSPDEFYCIRAVLETSQDLSILADVLKHASDSDDAIVLAAAADTLNYHFESFCAIGATANLFRRLIQAYTRLKKSATPSLDLVFSLIELGLRIPSEFNVVILLRQELSRMDNKAVGGMAASSPISDVVLDASSEKYPLSHEKLDQLLAPGNAMDEATLGAVFGNLINMLESGSGHREGISANDSSRYLARLRLFHPKYFDLLLVRWVCSVLESPNRAKLSKILAPLIGVGCVTIQAFISLLRNLLKQHEATGSSIPDMAGLQMGLLRLLIPVNPEQGKCFYLVCFFFFFFFK